MGFQYSKQQNRTFQLLHFILGQAKKNLSRKNKTDKGYSKDIRCVFKGLVK